LLAIEQPEESIRLLLNLEESARSSGRNGRLVEILMLTALGLQSLGKMEQAWDSLAESLALAEPQGYARIFLDEGQPMRQMIDKWLSAADANPVRKYASQILTKFKSETNQANPQNGKTSPARELSLIEPLSRRELEVLELIALGKTNQEVAQQLVVSRGTIKAHAASIYRKLEVNNRTEAVARARQLGMLL
jgi:LuxR family maltose regulon positive regulatory protein